MLLFVPFMHSRDVMQVRTVHPFSNIAHIIEIGSQYSQNTLMRHTYSAWFT